MDTIKRTLTLALILASFTGFTQKSISQNVSSENGKIKIHVEKDENGKKEIFDKTYNVEGMSADEKQLLIDRVTDSLTAGSGKNMKIKVKVNRDLEKNDDHVMTYKDGKREKSNKKIIIKKLDKNDANRKSNDDVEIDEDVEIDMGGMDFDMKDFEDKMGEIGKTLKFKFDEFGPMMKKFGEDFEPQIRNLGMGNSSKTVKSLNAFPNKPSNNKLNVKFLAPEKGDITITVTDIKGKEIGKSKIADFTGEYIGQVDLKGDVKGTVFVTVVQGEDGTVQRVVMN